MYKFWITIAVVVVCFGVTWELGHAFPLAVAIPLSLLAAVVITTIAVIIANEEEPLT